MAKKTASVWGQLVCDVADEKIGDPDQVLSELDSLGKSIEDLNTAVELLARRRQWAAQIAEGPVAEREHAVLKREKDDSVSRFTKLAEAHQEQQYTLEAKLAAARDGITQAADAERQLAASCSCQAALAAVANSTKQVRELSAERSELQAELQTKSDRRKNLQAQDDRDLQPHVARLSADLLAGEALLADLAKRESEAVAAAELARLALLKPEAI